MRYVGWLAVGLLLTLGPVTLEAQRVPSPYRYLETRHSPGIWGGYFIGDGGDLDLGPASAPIFGARYGFHLTGPLSVEANAGFTPTERSIFARATSGEGLVEIGPTDVYLGIADVALKFHVTGQRAWHGLAPFGLLGAGLALDFAGTDEREAAIAPEQRFDFGPAFAASVGLGSDYFLTEQFSLRVEARDYIWRLAYPAGLTASGAAENDWTNNFAITLGGAIHF